MTERPDNVADLARTLAVDRAFADLEALLESNPRLAARARAMLAGDLDAPDLEEDGMPATMNDEQVVLRCPSDTSDRADALLERMSAAPEFAGVRLTRSGVMRIALLRGLAALEAEHGKPKRRGG